MKRPPVPDLGINSVAKKIVGRRDSLLARKNIRDSLVSVAGLIGRPVRHKDGREIGRLVDVVVRHGEETYPPVSGLIVKVGQHLPKMKFDSQRPKLILKIFSGVKVSRFWMLMLSIIRLSM
jgi:sporulation protein YlmC with PRC-barrel domain